MFRNFNLYKKPVEDKIVIYKNIRHKLGVVNAEWIDKIVYKHKDISQFNLTIPQYIGKDKKYNPIYDKVFSGQFIIINDTEKYTLREKQGNIFKKDGKKIFTCYSYEKTFENKRVSIDGGNYQLISNDVVVTEGILETVLGFTRYKIGEVDRDAMYQMQMAEDTEILELYKNYIKNNVQFEQLLWEKDFNIDIGDNPLYININYLNIKTTNNDTVVKDGEKVYTTFTDAFYTGIKHIKCYYVTEEANRWACKYEITLKDGVVQEFVYPFTNITGYDVKFDVELTYGLGAYTEQELIKLPYFDMIDDSILNVLRDIEEAFDCTLDFDHINRVVNVVANKNVGITKGTLLSFDTNVLELNMEEDSVIPSALKVIGKDNLSISSENIFGGDTIYNYDYYMKFMSEECKSAWERYVELITIKKEEFRMLKDNRQILNNRLIRLDSEIKAVEKQIAYTKSLLSTFVAQEDKSNQASTKAELDELETKFNELQRNRSDLKSQIQKYDDDILVIADALNKETAKDEQGKIFTEDDLDELDSYTVVESLEDDYYTVPSALYLESERILKDKVVPKYEWKLKSTDITKVSNNWRKEITLGDLFKTEGKVRSSIGEDRVRLVEFTYVPSKKQITSLEFTNKDKKDDALKKYANSGRKTSGNNNIINSWNQIIQDAMLSNNFVDNIIKQGLDVTATEIRNRTGDNIMEISNAGIYIINKIDRDKQLFLGNSVISFTNDGFASSKNCLTPDGLIADVVVGKLLMGSELIICTTDETGEASNSFYIGNIKNREPNKTGENFGLRIADKDNKERIFIGLEKDPITGYKMAKFRLTSADGQDVVIDENGFLSHNYYEVWNNCSPSYPVETYFYVPEGVTKIKEVKLKLRLDRYRGFTKNVTTSTTTTTSGASNTSTTSSTNPHSHMLFKRATQPGDANIDTGCYRINSNGDRQTFFANLSILKPFGSSNAGDIMTYSSDNQHSHGMEHSHGLDIRLNTTVETGIKLYEKASNVSVYVNGKLVQQNITTNVDVDVTNFIQLNRDNLIQIYSSTNGYIGLGITSKYFIAW